MSILNMLKKKTGSIATNEVQVRAAKTKKGDRQAFFIKNGSNLFRVEPSAFSAISVTTGDDGTFVLYGQPEAEVEAGGTPMAHFKTLDAAEAAHALLSKAYAGIGMNRFGKGSWAIAIAALMFVVLISGGGGQGAYADMGDTSNPGGVGAPLPNTSLNQPVAPAGSFNKNETPLDDLIEGQYAFKPDLKMPEISAPALNCATN
jgi:hypothetical protein